ncbi:unnamed protein product (macronuclear) [Paramecium tetraurelia]|uniref:Uncharacterized protein n=1 Tax=Paramecium tetraurelia TaxID=5888 RepID=A0CYP8_PARTE|nr:uncharacterized protein GSPATT00011516001 [Paramecium tetraurelia]CAK75915.1 unnamed protein product [Paramecium tetraurelia]|eukprot:XP_001443312.1 hypothetical protein (macronuclear) [Paramecium tetraurelia strain d4-2]
MNISKSKNSVPYDKPIKSPQPDILSMPMQPLRIDMLLNSKNKLETQQSTKALDIIKQMHQSSTGNLRLDTSINKSKEHILKKTPTKTTASFHYDKTPDNSQNNLSYSPHTHACLKPQLKQSEDQLNVKNVPLQQPIAIKEQCEKIDQLNILLKELKQQLTQKEQENQKLQEVNIRLNQDNQKLYSQTEEMLKDLEFMRTNIEQSNKEFNNLKQQNHQLLDDMKLLRSERNKVNNNEQIINQKNKEISQLQNELTEHKQLLQAKDSSIQHLKQQFENLEQQQYDIMNKLEQKQEELSIIKQQQQLNIQNQRKSNQFESLSRRSSVQNEVLFYQAQQEQLQKEKEICEQKLVEMQTVINQFLLKEKKVNQPSSNSAMQQKEFNKMKQIIQIQKRQIESQQKTIMNQHYEIQNLQTLLYCSTEQDSQFNKKTFDSNDPDKFSLQSADIYHIQDKENDRKCFGDHQGVHHITFQQQQGSKFIMEDTFRNLDNELNSHNTLTD